MNTEEILETLTDLSKRYSLVIAYVTVEKGEDNFYFTDVTEDSFFELVGMYPHEMIKEALEQHEPKVDKEGCYEIKVLMQYQEEQRGSYPPPNLEIGAYLDVLHVEYKLMCTIEESEKQKLEMEEMVKNFEDLI